MARQQTQASHSPNAVELYRLSLIADERYAYIGRKFITTWREDGVILASAMLFQHMPPSFDSTTYTAPASARGRVILEHRRSRQLWTYIPQRNVVVHSVEPHSASLQSERPAALAALLKNYSLSMDAKAVSVAGRKTFTVTVHSKQANRPFNRLWIDPYTGIVLRRENYHSDASLSSVTYFSDVHLSPALSNATFSPFQWSVRRPRLVEAPAAQFAETSTDLAHLPAEFAGKVIAPRALDGFALQSSTLLHGKTQTALHLLYSDGMTHVSVYETLGETKMEAHGQRTSAIQLTGAQSARMTHSYSYTIITWERNGMEYSVVADLSVMSLRRFAASFLQSSAA